MAEKNTQVFVTNMKYGISQLASSRKTFYLRDDLIRKKRLNSGIARKWGGGLPMPEFFGPFFHQVISIIRAKRCFCRPEKKDQGAQIGGWGGLGNLGNARIEKFFSLEDINRK